MLRASNSAMQASSCSRRTMNACPVHHLTSVSSRGLVSMAARKGWHPEDALPKRDAYNSSGYPQGNFAQEGNAAAGYYPPVPGYQPSEPSAPYLPSGTSTYAPSSATSFSSSGYNPSGALGEAEQLATEDLELLRASAGKTSNLSQIGFWVQFALSIVSAGVLLFSSAFVPKVTTSPGFHVADISKYLTLVGVAAAFVSSLFAHGFLTLSRKLQSGGTVARSYMVGTLLTNNAICLGGIAITVVALQASVGSLVAKSLSTAASGSYQYAAANSGVVSLDVFALQASTNTLLCHVVGLLFTNLMLRIVNRPVT